MVSIHQAVTNWKTTTVGILQFVIVAATAAIAMLDGDAATNPDWNIVMVSLVALIGGIVARDSDKSSRDNRLS